VYLTEYEAILNNMLQHVMFSFQAVP